MVCCNLNNKTTIFKILIHKDKFRKANPPVVLFIPLIKIYITTKLARVNYTNKTFLLHHENKDMKKI